jgi:hypothetical protein
VGAPATPAAWHKAQVLLKTDLPAVFSAAAGAAAGAAGADVPAGEAAGAEASCLPQAASSAAAQIAKVSVRFFIGWIQDETVANFTAHVRKQNCRDTPRG